MNIELKIDKTIILIVLMLILLIVLFFILAFLWSPSEKDLFINIATEFIGILLTIAIIDQLIKSAEIRKWAKIKSRYIDNLGRSLLNIMFSLSKNLDRVSGEKDIKNFFAQLKNMGLNIFKRNMIENDKIFNQEYESPIEEDFIKYSTVKIHLDENINKANTLRYTQFLERKPETMELLDLFLRDANRFSQEIATLMETLKRKKPTDIEVKKCWLSLTKDYPNLISCMISLLCQLEKEKFVL